jgi:hypothetical protein
LSIQLRQFYSQNKDQEPGKGKKTTKLSESIKYGLTEKGEYAAIDDTMMTEPPL